MLKHTREFLKVRFFHSILFAVAFGATVLIILSGGILKSGQEIQVGSVAAQKYIAPKDTVDENATNHLRTEAAKTVGPLYKHDEEVQETSINEMNELFRTFNEILDNKLPNEEFSNIIKNAALKLPVVLTAKQCKAYEALPPTERVIFGNGCMTIITEIYEQGVTSEAIQKGKDMAQEAFEKTAWNDDLKSMGYTIVSSALKPNLVLDIEAMETARDKKRAEVPEVMIKKNQKIVDEGEIITTDIYSRMEALNLINTQGYKEKVMPIVGSLIAVALIFVAVFVYFYSLKKENDLKKNEMLMLVTIYILTVVLVRMMSSLTMFTVVPLTLFAMLVSLLINMRVALLLNCFMSIIGCLIFDGDAECLLYFLLTGSFAALMICHTEQRRYVIPVAVCMALVNMISMLAVGLFFEKGLSESLFRYGGYGAVAGLIFVVISIGSLPFWEAAFEANTPLRLLELTNPNNELLRRLMIEAPGTYHHSLIVANLAETAAYEIGASPALARVGAYYHDIGKLKYPLYFSENQVGENPHDFLQPYSSAQMIIQHTKTGAEMGEEVGLPKAVVSIIREHHGASLVKYFYFKAVKHFGTEEVEEKTYRYPGPVPQSKEAAIVMLADTVEAAVRSKLGHGGSLKEAEEMIQMLIKDKLDDGQLNQSGLAIHDMETIKKAFITVFHGMYHDRIAYPKQEELDKVRAEKKNKEKESQNNEDIAVAEGGETK